MRATGQLGWLAPAWWIVALVTGLLTQADLQGVIMWTALAVMFTWLYVPVFALPAGLFLLLRRRLPTSSNPWKARVLSAMEAGAIVGGIYGLPLLSWATPDMSGLRLAAASTVAIGAVFGALITPPGPMRATQSVGTGSRDPDTDPRSSRPTGSTRGSLEICSVGPDR